MARNIPAYAAAIVYALTGLGIVATLVIGRSERDDACQVRPHVGVEVGSSTPLTVQGPVGVARVDVVARNDGDSPILASAKNDNSFFHRPTQVETNVA